MAHHKERPVRLYTTLMHDASPRKHAGDEAKSKGKEPSWEQVEREKLELLSTQQLRAIAKREGIGVPRLRAGARSAYISRILASRARRRNG